MKLLLAVMRAQRNNSNIDLGIVDLVNHAILLVNAARPCLFKNKMLQVFHLTSTSTRMFLKLQQHIGDFLDGRFVTTLLYGNNFFLSLFGKKLLRMPFPTAN